MTTQITLNLPDEIYKKAEHFAKLTNRNISDVLAQVITLSLSPIASSTSDESLENTSVAYLSVNSLSDEEVIALTELDMEPEQNKRLSELLYNQQAGILTNVQNCELVALMQIYQEKLLVKAGALREAVERGLRRPLEA